LDSDIKTASDSEPAVDKEVEALSLPLPGTVEKDADETIPMECPLPPSPPVEADQISVSELPANSDLKVENALQVSESDSSEGYVTCSGDTADDHESTADVSSGFFHRAKHLVSAASKYRLRCQCGAKNCRQYLY